MADTLEIFGVEYPNATGIKATDDGGTVRTFIRPVGTKNITSNGTSDVTAYATVSVAVPSGSPNLQTVTKSYTPTESAITEAVTADSGYDGMDTVNVTVGAISSTYVGSDIAQNDSTDLTASGATVTAPAGYYATSASKTVASGTLSNLDIPIAENSLTLSVNASGVVHAELDEIHTGATPVSQSGWIDSSSTIDVFAYGSKEIQLNTQAATTITPTESSQTAVAANTYTTGAVTVGAISSTYVGSGIAQNDSTDLSASGATVTASAGYYAESASKTVASGSAGTPSASKGTVSNNSVSVTPSVTNTTGYITGGTKTGTAVTVSASELVSGTKSITANGTEDVTNYASVTVAVPYVTCYTGTSTPSSSLGSNGDIYVKVVS